MARYILIDRNSGYIWGDSADLDGKVFTGTALDFAKALDESLGVHGMDYEETIYQDAAACYDAYRADIDGSDVVPVVTDGQDQEMIEAVQEDCRYAGSILRTFDEDA